MGIRIQQQINQLSHTLPATVANLKSKLAKSDIGRQILNATGERSSGDFLKTAGSLFTTSFGVLGDVYIILFLCIFFTTNPDVYKNGLLLLMPPARKSCGIRS